MKMIDKNTAKLIRTIKECNKHKTRISYVMSKMRQFMPLTAKKYRKFDENEIEIIDLFIFRFIKLQDTIGARLFKQILEANDVDTETLSNIDILNNIEKYKIIGDKDEWIELREIRNFFTHEYPDENVDLLINQLNTAFHKTEKLFSIYNNGAYYAINRILKPLNIDTSDLII